MDERRVELAGSTPKHPNEARWSNAVSPDIQVNATIVVRRQLEASDIGEQLLSGHFQPVSRQQTAAALAAAPGDMAAVEQFAKQYGLTVLSSDAASRTIRVQGPITQMDRAFGIQLGRFADANGQEYLSYDGAISLPEAVSEVVVAVFGLDARPVAGVRGA